MARFDSTTPRRSGALLGLLLGAAGGCGSTVIYGCAPGPPGSTSGVGAAGTGAGETGPGGSTGAGGSATCAAIPLFGQCDESTPCSPCSGDLACVSSLCRPSCTVDADCPSGDRCAVTSLDGDCDLVLSCTESCTPLPDSCPQGSSCSLVVDPSSPDPFYVDCGTRAAGSQIRLTGCFDDHDCPAGRRCVSASGIGSLGASQHTACEPWCRLGATGDCPAGTTCVVDDPPILLDGVTYGACHTDCDPTQPCAGGGSCVVEVGGGATTTDCLPAGTGEGVWGCGDASHLCAPGSTCRVHGPGEQDCEVGCEVGASGACPAGTTCASFAVPLVMGGKTYGTCTAICDPLSSEPTCGLDATCAVVTDVPSGAVTACVGAGCVVGPTTNCTGSPNPGCAPGYQCAAFPLGTGTSALYGCEKYCRVGHPEDCATLQSCAGLVPAAVVSGVTYGLCEDDCDLTDPAGTCGAGATCIPVLDGQNPPHAACVGAPLGQVGGACTDAASCLPGATCQNGTCVEWCKLGPTGHCAGSAVCAPSIPPLTLGGVSYGTCG